MRTSLRSLLTVTAVAVLGAGLAAPAAADPGFAPAQRDIVGVGSDTTQDVLNGLAAKYNAANPGQPRLASYNATGTATITPGTGCTSIPRPNGSSAGIEALLAPANGNNCIDFARSSREPRAGSGATFFAFARDGVTWAKRSTSNAPGNLTTAQLRAIYACAPTARNWSAFGGRSGTIVPVLPQAESGTRAFFLTALGLTTPGGCVRSGETAQFQENQGNLLLANANAIAPYSAAKWAAQSKGASPDQRRGAVLGNLNATAPLSGGALNPGFTAGFTRTVYNVVKTGRAGEFGAVFGPSGYVCSPAGQTEVARFGFGRLSASTTPRCGSTRTGV